MAYTDEQIAQVCKEVRDEVSKFTTVQNASFTTTYIINGMKANKTADEISDDIWQTYNGLSQYPDQYGLVGAGAVNRNNMLNVAQIANGAVHKAIAAIPEPEEEPEVIQDPVQQEDGD